MRVSNEQRHRTEQRIRAAASALLRGELPPGGKCDITTLARQAGISRAALYRSYPHLKTEFEQQLTQLRDSGQTPDPRESQITRLKASNAKLGHRILRQDAELGELRQFKTLALSRLAAQHDEIHRLRTAATRTTDANVTDLASRRAAPGGPATGPPPP